MDTLLDTVEKEIGYPAIVKPLNLGSSVGISVAKNRVELTKSIDDAFSYASKVIVEHAITKLREINCSVLGDENDAIASEDVYKRQATLRLSTWTKSLSRTSTMRSVVTHFLRMFHWMITV